MKKGQVTIFIIVGILIVASVALFFASRAGIIPGVGGGTKEADVNSFLNVCFEDEVKNAVNELAIFGGYFNNPNNLKFKFMDEGIYRNISYLCYTQNNFRPCVVQKPTFFSDFQKNIEEEISDVVYACFKDMLDSFDKQGFEVGKDSRLNGFEIDLASKRIILQTYSKVVLTKAGETKIQENFQVVIPSRIYEVLNVVEEIINQESNYCYFERRGFGLMYPEFEIDLFRMEDFTEIYTVENTYTSEKFRFAVRGCSLVI